MKIKKLTALISAAGLAAMSLASPAIATEIVDVLVLYTPDAKSTRNGADMDARISSYIAFANRAYENSQVDMRLRLVGSRQVDAYGRVTESNLDSLRRDSTVARLRRETGADLVALVNLRQQVSGGYVCGIGYVPSGNSDSGQFYSNASAVGYSLVGVDCGVNTFVHELGHNMGLGHSHAQNSRGGVWPWARGHGVSGAFSTVMAYPQSYGTNNHLPVFSNPNIDSCQGLACGVERSRTNGADAAGSLTALATQISGFMSTVVDIASDDTPADQPSAPPPTTSQPCSKTPAAGNLLQNGEFDALTGWSSGFGLSTLSTESRVVDGCRDNVLVVSNRTEYYSSAFQSTSGKLNVGSRYRLSGKLGIGSSGRENVRVALRVRGSGGSQYNYLNPISVTGNELTAFSEEFSLTSGDLEGVLIYGPPAGVDLVMDSLVLVPVDGEQQETANTPPTADDLAINEQFERSANGWGSYLGGRLSYSTDAAAGQYSLRASWRTRSQTGPALDIRDALKTGNLYQLKASVKVRGTSAEQPVQAWLFYQDDSGSRWQRLADIQASSNHWHALEGEFSADFKGDLVQARLHLFGPEAGHELLLDDLTVKPL